jgi:Uncharacterized conserved protein
MRRSRNDRRKQIYDDEEQNPLTGVANLFDIAMVFSVALLVALVMSYQLPELLSPTENITIVKNPGAKNMEMIIKEAGEPVKVLDMSENKGTGAGEYLGAAYRLPEIGRASCRERV